MRVRVIVNPKAGAGSAAKRLPQILREIERAGALPDSAETLGPGDAARLVREAHADQVDCVALVGGDGTLNEAVQAFIGPNGEARPGPVLAIIPSGTGGDFRKTFHLGTSTEEAVARLMSSPPRPVDLGLLEVTSHEGASVHRAFINVTSFGLGGLTNRIVNSSPKWWGGTASFMVGAVRALAVYENAPVEVRVDGRTFLQSPIVNVAIANARYFGGGMKIAPDADPADGMFDVVAIGDLSRARSLSLTPHIYRGTHVEQADVHTCRGTLIEAHSLVQGAEVLVDMDGETPGRLPLKIRCAPAALAIRI
ncbi:MAG: diacylglycerol kinase family lipid kinase [Polyangiaceae bacterium]